jgi:hypothetical protein
MAPSKENPEQLSALTQQLRGRYSIWLIHNYLYFVYVVIIMLVMVSWFLYLLSQYQDLPGWGPSYCLTDGSG